mgnify:CR=1 FL=1
MKPRQTSQTGQHKQSTKPTKLSQRKQLVGWLVGCCVVLGWLVGWLAGCCVEFGWLAGWLAVVLYLAWLADAGWVAVRLPGCFFVVLIMVGCCVVIGWLVDWLVG